MRVLILSCNTGEGHNSAGKAMKEALELAGHEAVMLDIMSLSGPRTSKLVGNGYIQIASKTPHFFQIIYKLGMLYSKTKIVSPVYLANARLAKKLELYLEEHPFDALLMPHLYPAETVTYMKKHHMLKIPAVCVGTDYTCIPFWEETKCDAYVVPDERCLEEFAIRGVPREKLYSYGIPVKNAFQQRVSQKEAKEELRLPVEKPLFLIMGGSMGFGKIQLFTLELSIRCKRGEQILVICGNNKKLYRVLKKELMWNRNVHIVGYTEHVAQYLDACDVVYTKPGGLTSTEVIVKNRPLIHTAPIPGCETVNRDYFVEQGLSLSGKRIHTQIHLGKILITDQITRDKMLETQRELAKPDAAVKIVSLLQQLVQDWQQK